MASPVPRGVRLCLLLLLLWPELSRGEQLEVLQPGLFSVGNIWQFQSQAATSSGGWVNFTMTWRIAATENVGGYNTYVLREDASPYYVLDMNVFLDPAALTIPRSVETQFNPTIHIITNWSDPMEKIARYLNTGDVQRVLGHGEAFSYIEENPSIRETRTEDHKVTFFSNAPITVPAGTFSAVAQRVDESWRFTDGRWGLAQRTYWINHTIGPVMLHYQVINYDAQNRAIGAAESWHRLSGFSSAVPELYATNVSFSPPQLQVGQTLNVSWSEACVFRNATVPHQSSIYLSTDTLLTSNDYLLTTRSIPAMAFNQVYNAAGSGVIPGSLPAGQYHVGVLVDSNNAVGELDEGNNAWVTPTLVTIESKPDLTVTEVDFSPTVLAPGQAVTVTGKIRNVGGAASPPNWTHIYLSTDNVIDVGDFALVTGLQVPGLAPGLWYPINSVVTIPPQLPFGSYYVGIMTDVNNAIPELNETNNTAIAPQLLVAGLPDLQAISGSVTPPSVWLGQNLWVQATVRNTGVLPAGPSWAELYLSPDTVITSADLIIQSGIRLPPLSAGQNVTLNVWPRISAVPRPGTYFVGIVCDLLNEVVESDETNNRRVLGMVVVNTAPPDLTAEGLDVMPRVVRTGGALGLDGSVTNVGGAPTSSSVWAELYVSPHPDLSAPRYFLCPSIRVPPLAVGQRFRLNPNARTVSSGIPAGVYSVGIVLDRINEATDANRANNTVVVSEHKLYVNRSGPSEATRWQLYR